MKFQKPISLLLCLKSRKKPKISDGTYENPDFLELYGARFIQKGFDFENQLRHIFFMSKIQKVYRNKRIFIILARTSLPRQLSLFNFYLLLFRHKNRYNNTHLHNLSISTDFLKKTSQTTELKHTFLLQTQG